MTRLLRALYRTFPLLNPAHVCTSSHCILHIDGPDAMLSVFDQVNVCLTSHMPGLLSLGLGVCSNDHGTGAIDSPYHVMQFGIAAARDAQSPGVCITN